MEMIRHYGKFVNSAMVVILGEQFPLFGHNLAKLIQNHLIVRNPAKVRAAMFHVYSYKIQSIGGVVVAL